MRRGLALAFALAVAPACSLLVQPNESLLTPDGAVRTDGSVPDANRPDVPVDGPMHPDVPVQPDAPVTCTGSCDDSVPCTVDTCDATTHQCAHTPDSTLCGARMICDLHTGCIAHECTVDSECSDNNACNGVEHCVEARCVGGTAPSCDDGQSCNGTETCSPATGCVPGTPMVCDDMNPCTTDRCDATANGGHGACAAMPIGGCTVPPPNDLCASATPITLGTATATVTGTTVNASNGDDSTCGGTGGGDVWYAVTYPAANDLRIETAASDSRADPVLVVRESCTGEDLVCNDDVTHSDHDSRIWIRGATGPASGSMRTMYVIVDAYGRGSESAFTLTVTATAPIDSTACRAGGGFDVTSGGTVLGVLQRGPGQYNGSCSAGGQSGSEDIYHYAAPAGSSVTWTGRGQGFNPNLYARGGQCENGPELRCDNGNPVTMTYTQGLSGNSYVFVDNAPASGMSPYTLRVEGP